jgi:uncharacterized protein (DUF885 family)
MKPTMRSLAYLTLLLFTFACTSDRADDSPRDLGKVMTDYNESRLKLNPLDATFQGDSRYNDYLPNFLSVEHREELDGFYTCTANALKTMDRATMSPEDKVSYDVLKWETDINREALTFREDLLPLDQFNGFHLMIGQLASGQSAQPFKTAEDYDNWLGRAADFTKMLDTAMVRLQQGVEQGYVLPASLIAKLQPQLDDMAKEPLEDHLFYGPIRSLPEDITGADRDRLTTGYRNMVQEITTKFTELSAFVREDYAPSGRASSGISEIPQGPDYYKHLIKRYTTTSMTADEIHQLGLQEVARLTEEMEKVKTQVGYDGDLKSFFDYVRTKPELSPFDKPEQVIANFNAIHEKMKPQLAKLFDQTPKTSFEVRRTEAFREASASAEYNPGSQDGTRPGVFYVPIPDVENYNIFSDEDLFLHEAIPGHHYQISLTQENENLPDFRRSLWYSAYGEGWALYTESLGKELGLYDDPYQYFGMLSAEMHRAIRLVVDTGLHSKGWSREKAIQYSLDNEAESEASIIAEIERYMAIPGQALSYKIGQLKIRELRAKAELELGDKFDIKAFHNLVLSPGCVPLAVLETMVVEWMAER